MSALTADAPVNQSVERAVRLLGFFSPEEPELTLAELNETVVLSIWDGEAPVVVRADDNTERLARIVVRAGSRLPLTDSAQGKVYCAFLPELESNLERAELESIRASRIAVNSRVVAGIRAVATPVFQDRELAGAMAVVGTAATIPDDPSSPLARRLRAAAERLSEELGFLRTERSTA